MAGGKVTRGILRAPDISERQPSALGIQHGRAPLSCEKHGDTALGALPPTYLPTTQTTVPGRLDSGGATIGILRELPVLPEKGVGTQGMLGACGLRRGTTPEHHTHTDLNLNLTLPGTIPGGQGRSGVTRGILRESPGGATIGILRELPVLPDKGVGTQGMLDACGLRRGTAPEPHHTPTDPNLNLTLPGTMLGGQGRPGVTISILRESPDSAANLRPGSPWIDFRPSGTPEVGHTPLRSPSPFAPVAPDLASAALASPTDYRALPPRPSPSLPAKPASPTEFLPHSASSASVVDTSRPRPAQTADPHGAAPATLLASQPPAGSASVVDTNTRWRNTR